jgi:4-hydroxybenzoate polyprenyltransferase
VSVSTLPIRRIDCAVPICVDLDGTLIQGDIFAESVLAVLRANCLLVFLIPIWICGGIANLKAKIASYHSPDPALLPYNEDLLEFLRRKRREGHQLYLTTAASSIHAERVAGYLRIFDGVLSSTPGHNLKGERKLNAISKLLGQQPFLYAGNSRSDVAIWRQSAGVIAVNTPRRVQNYVDNGQIPVTARFPRRRSWWSASLRALRPYQWVKNVLVFVPVLLAHQYLNTEKLLGAAIAFLSFSLCASSFYVLNDLFDIEADRSHPRKRTRPFASGDLSIGDGFKLMAAVAILTVVCASFLPASAVKLLAVYAIVNVSYSLRLKQLLFFDTVILAFLYTLRIFVGSQAADIEVSMWTLAFAIFFFLGLALMKRLTELVSTKDSRLTEGSRRAYAPTDIAPLNSFASSALYGSVLIMFLYINSPDVARLYTRPEALWFISLPLLYWIGRSLMLANRGLMTDDPIVFAFKDVTSYFVGLAIVVCALLAT